MKKREFLHFQRIRTLFSQLFSYLIFVHRFDISLFQLSHSRRVMKKHILLSFSILGLATIAPAQNQDPFAADQAAEQNKASTKKNKAASHSNDGHPKIISACFETFSLSNQCFRPTTRRPLRCSSLLTHLNRTRCRNH